MKAEQRARELSAQYPGPVPIDVESIAEAEGLEIVDCSFHELQEVWLWPCVAVKRDLPESWRRWVIAHAMGHYYLHRGNQLWFRRRDDVLGQRQESQAERFAAWLLIPEEEVAQMPSLDLWTFAETFDVPLECVATRFPR